MWRCIEGELEGGVLGRGRGVRHDLYGDEAEAARVADGSRVTRLNEKGVDGQAGADQVAEVVVETVGKEGHVQKGLGVPKCPIEKKTRCRFGRGWLHGLQT